MRNTTIKKGRKPTLPFVKSNLSGPNEGEYTGIFLCLRHDWLDRHRWSPKQLNLKRKSQTKLEIRKITCLFEQSNAGNRCKKKTTKQHEQSKQNKQNNKTKKIHSKHKHELTRTKTNNTQERLNTAHMNAKKIMLSHTETVKSYHISKIAVQP